jgi:hypothetical protein
VRYLCKEQEHMICFEKDGKDHKDNGTGRAKKSALQATYPIQSGRNGYCNISFKEVTKDHWTVDRHQEI